MVLEEVREGEYGSVAVDRTFTSHSRTRHLARLHDRGLITYRYDLQHYKTTDRGREMLRRHAVRLDNLLQEARCRN